MTSNQPSDDLPPETALEAGAARLDRAIFEAVAISDKNIGVNHTGRQNRALFTLAKLTVHCMSMQLITRQGRESLQGARLLDYFSLGALARSAIDAALMTMYISHPVLNLDEWNLRRHVLYLHDLTNRARFLRSAAKTDNSHPPAPFFENYEEMKSDLRRTIASYATSLRYQKSRADELKTGSLVFVEGARGAVREAGWDVDAYDFHQSYLSAYVHSHPVSFMKADEHQISFSKPSDFQLSFCGFVSDVVASYAEDATRRMDVFCASFESDPLGQVD